MKLSNLLMGTLNFFTLALSIPIIVVGIWLATQQDSLCMQFLQQPTIAVGAIILLISVVGFVGSCYRISWMLWIYLFVMLLLILLLLFFTVFAFMVTNQGASHAVAGTGFSEYRIGDYSSWLQNKVEDADNWRRIKSCLHDSNICLAMVKYHDEESFRNASLSPLESGCCKPPTSCGYGFENATLWNVVSSSSHPEEEYEEYEDSANSTQAAAEATIGKDPDCSTWSNNQEQLCFNCHSCRAGLLSNIRHDWRKVAIVNVIVLVFLVVVYTIGCCAFYNAKKEGCYTHHGLGRFWF